MHQFVEISRSIDPGALILAVNGDVQRTRTSSTSRGCAMKTQDTKVTYGTYVRRTFSLLPTYVFVIPSYR